MIQPETIQRFAEKEGWKVREHQPANVLLILERGKEQMNVWYTKMTIGTVLNHPTKGRNMLYRKGVSLPELQKLLRKPRAHTGKGYYQQPVMKPIMAVGERLMKKHEALYDPSDTEQMWPKNQFPDPAATLLNDLWKLKPRFWDNRAARSKKRHLAISLVEKHLYGGVHPDVR